MATTDFKKKLQTLLEQIREQQEKAKADHPAHNDSRDIENSDEDDTTEAEHGFRNQNLLTDLQRKESMILEALDRIEKGSFGICQNCGKKIPTARLEAVPYTRYCIECQTMLETTHPELSTPS